MYSDNYMYSNVYMKKYKTAPDIQVKILLQLLFVNNLLIDLIHTEREYPSYKFSHRKFDVKLNFHE